MDNLDFVDCAGFTRNVVGGVDEESGWGREGVGTLFFWRMGERD